MAMSTDEFKNAFRMVISSEFSHIPCDEESIDFTFSDRFNKRMEKLIRSQKKAYYTFINTTYKKVAIICVVLLMLLTTACSVDAIREPIVNFFTEVYESFNAYFFTGDTTDEITYVYTLTQLPEGFVQTDYMENDNSVITVYENEAGEIIEFMQTITDGALVNADTQNADKFTLTISGQTLDVYESPHMKNILWTKDGYFLNLTCYGDFDLDIITEIITGIE